MKKKALFIIDVQESFVIERNKYIIPNIIQLIQEISYDLIVYSVQYNDKNSLWYHQIGWCEEPKETDIIPIIGEVLKGKNVLKVHKLTRSIWKSDEDIIKKLKENDIEEIHLCGYESNDCVLASILESFDLGFYTFMIEEVSEIRTTALNHTYSVELLKYLKLTNNSNYVGKNLL